MTNLSIVPRDPIVARDGRPFSAAQRRMRSLDWPYPSVLAGSLRTLLGKLADLPFSGNVSERLRELEIAGPLPMREGLLYFPAPADIAVREGETASEGRAWHAARPRQAGGGCNFRAKELQPVMLARELDDFKPARIPAFWSADNMVRWLVQDPKFATPPVAGDGNSYLDAPQRNERTHVFIEEAIGAAKEAHLFQTAGLEFPVGLAMGARAHTDDGEFHHVLADLNAMHPLGGERRMAHWKAGGGGEWSVPQGIVEALGSTRLVRMILATPAIFAGGWRPGWVKDDLSGTPPGSDVRLRLVGVCIQRWRAVSGWSLESSDRAKPGPKAVKRTVPAGGVYFFRVETGEPEELAKQLWLRPVSDDPQDCRDGFGLALWGPWSEI